MEQILIRNLPAGTKAALRSRAAQNHRSLEAEVREILTTISQAKPSTLVDLLSSDVGVEFDFEPDRLGLSARGADF